MDQQQARAIASRFIDRLHQLEDGDQSGIDQLADMFSDDAELSNSVLERDGSRCTGRQQIVDFWRSYRSTFGEVHSDFHEVTTSDHAAGLFWQSNGTDPSGKPLDYEGVTLLTFDENGKIVGFKAYFDAEQMTFRSNLH